MLNSQGLGEQVQRKKEAYQGNPRALQQRYQQSQELVDLLALQQLKSEKEAAARDMQMQMEQNPATIAQQREQEVLGMIKQEQGRKLGDVAQRTAGTLGQINKKTQQNMQRTAKQGLPAMGGPRKPAMMAGGGIVAFDKGGEVETVSVADAIATLGEETYNYIKENPVEAASILGITLLTGGLGAAGAGAGLAIRGGVAALRSKGIRSAIQKLMRGKQPDTAPPVTRLKRGAAERDRPVDPGKQLVESGVRSDKQLMEVGTGPRGMVPYTAPKDFSTAQSIAARTGIGQFVDPEQKFEKEYENLYPPDLNSFPPKQDNQDNQGDGVEPVDYFAGVGELSPVKPEFGTMARDAVKERAGILGLAGAKEGDPTPVQARDAEQERVMGLLGKTEKLGVKDEQLRRLQDLQGRQMDPEKLRQERIQRGLIGMTGRSADTMFGGYAAGKFNERIKQEAAERKNLVDQFGIENEKIQLDFDITSAGIEGGMKAFEINKADRRAIANDLTKATDTDLELGKAYARQVFDSNAANLATRLTQASAAATRASEEAKGRREAIPKLIEEYNKLTQAKFDVYQELQKNSDLMGAFRSGDKERVERALLQTEIAGAQLAELAQVHAAEELLENQLRAMGAELPTRSGLTSGNAELDQLIKTYGSM